LCNHQQVSQSENIEEKAVDTNTNPVQKANHTVASATSECSDYAGTVSVGVLITPKVENYGNKIDQLHHLI
jgi:hypothetical protein